MSRRPRGPPPFPSTTLFRSLTQQAQAAWGQITINLGSEAVALRGQYQDRKSTRLNSSHSSISYPVFFFNEPAPPRTSPLPLHDALPIFNSTGTGRLGANHYQSWK